jgi:hypothetical protein
MVGGKINHVRLTIPAALVALLVLSSLGSAQADRDGCAQRFPEADWSVINVDTPLTVATAGMSPEMAARFAADVEHNARLVQSELGGLDGAAVCLTTPEIRLDVGDLVAEGQRLHVAVFAEEKLFVLSAVEIRMIDDAIAFGLPHIALWQVAAELGVADGYPEPLGSTIAHWYLARAIERMPQYHGELVVGLFLDDPNPEERTEAEATRWVDAAKDDPFLFDPQFVGSPMGDFIDYAVTVGGVEVLRDIRQETWGPLENEWRVALRDELLEGRTGSYGAEWGVVIVVVVLLLAVLLAWGKRRQKRRAATPRPTPPVDESLFVSRDE